MKRASTSLTVAAALVLTLGGCERGCLRTWLDERGAAPPGTAASPAAALGGTDCSDGLARCVAGDVEVSRQAHVPDTCIGPQVSCSCPWDRITTCAGGCAAEGVVVLATREAAGRELCAPPPGGAPFFRAAPPSVERAPDVCDDDADARCSNGLIVRCAAPPRVAGVCLHGCARDALDGEQPISDQALGALLCRRAPAADE